MGERFPYRLFVGGGGAERTIKGELLPTAPLREATRIASVAIGVAIVKRLTKGRVKRLRVRKLAWDSTSRMWFLILDF